MLSYDRLVRNIICGRQIRASESDMNKKNHIQIKVKIMIPCNYHIFTFWKRWSNSVLDKKFEHDISKPRDKDFWMLITHWSYFTNVEELSQHNLKNNHFHIKGWRVLIHSQTSPAFCHRWTYSISQEICTRFLLFCALLRLYIDWFSHIHQAYFTGTVAI